MRLFELAYCCRLYGQITGSDASLIALQNTVGQSFDPSNDMHCSALFKWLNSWGCRQFAKEHHSTTATPSLRSWADQWFGDLPQFEVHLDHVSPGELDKLAEAYDSLRGAQASLRARRGGQMIRVTFGPTGAAKALFALRPNVFPPWDDPIRHKLGYGPGREGFLKYISDVQVSLRTVSVEANSAIPDLPNLLQRPASSPPKLIDEYNWVVHTLGYHPPDAAQLRQWLAWAEGNGGAA